LIDRELPRRKFQNLGARGHLCKNGNVVGYLVNVDGLDRTQKRDDSLLGVLSGRLAL
tara:strand:+ start:57 stop:227 length:171 start_codon:yes stop_codon:yes gene_type:complete